MGRRHTRDGAVGLRRLGVQPQRTLCSPLVRARQTAEIVQEGLKLERPIEFVDSLAGWRPSRIIADASMVDVESVLLVGHEPTLSELIGLLIGGREASLRLRPGSIARLNAPDTPSRPLRRAGVAADTEAAGGVGSIAPPTQGAARAQHRSLALESDTATPGERDDCDVGTWRGCSTRAGCRSGLASAISGATR